LIACHLVFLINKKGRKLIKMIVTRSNILNNESIRDKFISGVKLLKEDRIHPNWPNTYDIFIIWHFTAMMTPTPNDGSERFRNAAHGGPVFLPWHRWFLLVLENHLQRVLGDSNFGLPYWDWGADGDLPEDQQTSSGIWADNCMGGSGDPVRTGPFAEGLWTVNYRQQLNSDGALGLVQVNSPLRRNIGVKVDDEGQRTTLPTKEDIKTSVRRENSNVLYDTSPWNVESDSFRNDLEGYFSAPPVRMHNAIHVWVGGDMVLSSSPNDPIFFLNHCNVDRIWAGWQQIHDNPPYLPGDNENPNLQRHRLNDLMYEITTDEQFDPLFKGRVRPAELLDVSSRYVYDKLNDL
jgi:tyrosinase